MTRYRLTTADGSVLREWDSTDARTAEDEAVRTVEEHRASDPQGAAEYLLTDEGGGDVARWGPVAP